MKDKGSMINVPGLRSVPLTAKQRALLVSRRKALGLSQEELGKKVGVILLSIHNIEAGNCRPTPTLLAKLCRVLKLDASVRIQVNVAPAKVKRRRRTA